MCVWAGWSLADLGRALLGVTPSRGLGPCLFQESSIMLVPAGLLGHILPLAKAETQMGWVEIHNTYGLGLEGTIVPSAHIPVAEASHMPAKLNTNEMGGTTLSLVGRTAESHGKEYRSQEKWTMGLMMQSTVGACAEYVWCAGAVPWALYTWFQRSCTKIPFGRISLFLFFSEKI